MPLFDRSASKNRVTTSVRTKQAFQQLWVAGTLGAFFIAVARTLPGDIKQLVYSFNIDLGATTFLRYMYLGWLIWYFFLSNLRRQPDSPPYTNDIPFDVVQSVFALSAAFFLDFLTPNAHHGIRVAFTAANLAIFIICALAWFWFPSNAKLQKPRGISALVALVSAIAAFELPKYLPEWAAVALLLAPFAVLVWALRQFHRERIAEVDGPTAVSAAPVKTDVPKPAAPAAEAKTTTANGADKH
jgi:hypothetical protein